MKTTVAAFAALTAMTQSALAAACPPGATCSAVPEISAMEGTAAIVALAAIVLLAWERRRAA